MLRKHASSELHAVMASEAQRRGFVLVSSTFLQRV